MTYFINYATLSLNKIQYRNGYKAATFPSSRKVTSELLRIMWFQRCGGLSTFRSLCELLSGFVSTKTTQILQARKQMECDNNKY